MNISTTILNATAAIISPTATKAPRSALTPVPGAPLSADQSLVPPKYLSEKSTSTGASPSGTTSTSPISSTASSVNLHPARVPPPALNLVRSPPSQLLDAPARAALNMPNSMTAPGQARAVRGGEARTPEYEIDVEDYGSGNGNGNGSGTANGVRMGWGDASRGRAEENVPLLAPTPMRPGLSRSSSAASTSSNRGILRRIFIDRATTPSQHLTRPTFPPPSLSTYAPQPPSPLTLTAKINLFINQGISIALSTVFLAFVVSWAMSVEVARALPRWIWPGPGKKFPWDDEKYWKKEGRKISKEPRDYALQVGMDIENQVVETEDGYHLR